MRSLPEMETLFRVMKLKCVQIHGHCFINGASTDHRHSGSRDQRNMTLNHSMHTFQEAILLIYSLVKAEYIENVSHPCFCVAV